MRFLPALVLTGALVLVEQAGATDTPPPDRHWWSLQPLRETTPPTVRQQDWPRTGVDRFILAALEAKGLTPSPEAARISLLRRVTYDLTGLPPTPADTAGFLADPSPDAYAGLVDRLLASPAYGEKWARHWLDVARYGESDGFEYDKPRPEAWRYRDWVIDALNADQPYDEFVRWQIAGDVISPGNPAAVTATGFLVCGPYDDTAKATASETLRKTMRQDELEDVVGTVGQVFLGLTVHCARCHDHKFDPVPTRDYYRLASCFAGLDRGNRPLPAAEDDGAQPSEITDLKPIAEWTFDTAQGLELLGAARIEDGKLVLDGRSALARTPPLQVDLREKTLSVQVSLDSLAQQGGAAMSVQTLDGNVFDAVVFGEKEEARWMAGSEGFGRTESFGGTAELSDQTVRIDLVYYDDGTVTAFRDGHPYGQPYRSKALQPFTGGQWQVVFGLRHGTEATAGRMLAGRIETARLYDRALWSKPAAPASAFAVTPQTAPVVAHLLNRGSALQPGEAVAPGALECLGGGDFGLAADAPEAERRRALAEWLTRRDHPLFARTLVNRVWHWHFGRGLVATPNDLGRNGGEASHPELLDWLAGWVRDHGWSMKQLHRLLVTSAAYRQSSAPRPEAAMVDGSNQLLWRMPPRRLSAEELRDTMLAVSGALNPQRGGPSFHDFRMENTANTMHYVAQDRDGPEVNRRSIYRMWARGGANPLLSVFDCPDPSVSTPARAVTITPLSALSLLNSSFTFAMADHGATRLCGEAGDDLRAQIEHLHRLAFSRMPTPEELDRARDFSAKHGLAALCRVVFNSNEFLFVP